MKKIEKYTTIKMETCPKLVDALLGLRLSL